VADACHGTGAALAAKLPKRATARCREIFQSGVEHELDPLFPGEILVVSDLHLGVGRDPRTGNIKWTENFVGDGAFRRFVDHFAGRLSPQALLVLNGDTFDFDRIASVPDGRDSLREWSFFLGRLGYHEDEKELEKQIFPHEYRYGLRTNDFKSVWKLWIAARGHAEVFKALAGWVAGGRRVLFVLGNHDLELSWPLVQSGVRELLRADGASNEQALQNVRFAPAGVLLDNVYLEHGHEYERITSVRGGPFLDNEPDQIRLPLGSFINRYLINRLERLDPFLDNIKPVQQAVLKLLRARPLEVFRIYGGWFRFFGKAMQMGQADFFVLGTLLGLLVPVIVLAVFAAAIIFPGFRGAIENTYERASAGQVAMGLGGLLFPALMPYIAGAVSEFVRRIKPRSRVDHLMAGARQRIEECLSSVSGSSSFYAVMGHTHAAKSAIMETPLGTIHYFNTGTWIGLWSQERVDMMGRFIYTFLLLTRDHDNRYQHEFMVWNDEACCPRQLQLLVEPE
jgi:UDP-2,3-diacylglucosamine pyrophosphatase LpxH